MQKRTLLTALASAPLLAACGFKLRGSVDFAFKSLYLNGAPNSPFLKELQRNLEAAGTLKVLRDASEALQADAIFDDLGQRRERIVVSRNAAGEVRELGQQPGQPAFVHSVVSADLPPAADWPSGVLRVADLDILAVSNGSAWIRQDTGAPIA